jgi:hypothetical protein
VDHSTPQAPWKPTVSGDFRRILAMQASRWRLIVKCRSKRAHQSAHIKEDEAMRALKAEELTLVSGGHNVCTPEDAMNDFYGIQNTNTLGQDLINIYEGAIGFTSYVIERVALSFYN